MYLPHQIVAGLAVVLPLRSYRVQGRSLRSRVQSGCCRCPAGASGGSSVTFSLRSTSAAGKLYFRSAKSSLWSSTQGCRWLGSVHILKWNSCGTTHRYSLDTKAGSSIFTGRSALGSEASWPGKMQGSLSVLDCSKGRDAAHWVGYCCHVALRPRKRPISYPTSRSNAEELCFPLNPSAITARERGFHSQQARDSHTQRGHTNTDLALQQPSLKAPNTLLVGSPYLTTTTQQTVGTATEQSSRFSSLLSWGFPMHSATYRSLQAARPACPSCPSQEGHSNCLLPRLLGYRAVALLAWVTKPASGGLEIKQELTFILLAEEKVAFPALQNDGTVCNTSDSHQQLAGCLASQTFWTACLHPILGTARGDGAGFLLFQRGTTRKAGICSLTVTLQPLPGPLRPQGKLLPRGKHWGGSQTSAPYGHTPSYFLPASSHCQVEGGGSRTGA